MIRFKGQKHVVYHMDFFPDSSNLVTIGGSSTAVWLWNLKDPKKAEKYQFPKLPTKDKFDRLLGVVVSHENEIIVRVSVYENYRTSQLRVEQQMYCISWPNRELRIVPFNLNMWPRQITTAMSRSWLATDARYCRWCPIDSKLKWESFDFDVKSGEKVSGSDNLEWFAQFDYFEVRTYHRPTKTFSDDRSFEHEIDGVIFSPSGKYFVVNGNSQYFQVFETATFKPVGQEIVVDASFTAPQFTPDDKKLLITSDHTVRIYDVQTSEELASYDFNIGRIVAMKISDDGLMYAVSGENKEIVVADIES